MIIKLKVTLAGHGIDQADLDDDLLFNDIDPSNTFIVTSDAQQGSDKAKPESSPGPMDQWAEQGQGQAHGNDTQWDIMMDLDDFEDPDALFNDVNPAEVIIVEDDMNFPDDSFGSPRAQILRAEVGNFGMP